MSDVYDVVLFVNDDLLDLPANLKPIEDAINSYKQINPQFQTTLNVIPFPAHPSRKLMYLSTGNLASDLADSRNIRFNVIDGVKAALNLGFKKPLLVLGPLASAQPQAKYALPHYALLTAGMGASHALHTPLQVQEMRPSLIKYEKLGILGATPNQLLVIRALQKGVAVLRDIGNADPVRMSPPNIKRYLEQKEADWRSHGITLTFHEPTPEDFPLAAAVDRGNLDNKARQGGKIVFARYDPPSDQKIDTTLLLVGKGVTMDTGGADLKINGGMRGMHTDKMGAAFVAGFFEVLRNLQPKGLKAYGYMPFIRNTLGKLSYLPDEIVMLKNGRRVRIMNTDAEGRNIMADVLYYAQRQAQSEVNPHIFTIATLTGAAVRAYGDVTVSMDNGPAEDVHMANNLSNSGDLVGDPSAVARIRYEDYQKNYGIQEFEDIEQYNPASGATSSRGFTFPMGYLSLVSGLDQHGRSAGVPLKYTHCDIAASAGGINELATGSPLRMFAQQFIFPRVFGN